MSSPTPPPSLARLARRPRRRGRRSRGGVAAFIALRHGRATSRTRTSSSPRPTMPTAPHAQATPLEAEAEAGHLPVAELRLRQGRARAMSCARRPSAPAVPPRLDATAAARCSSSRPCSRPVALPARRQRRRSTRSTSQRARALEAQARPPGRGIAGLRRRHACTRSLLLARKQQLGRARRRARRRRRGRIVWSRNAPSRAESSPLLRQADRSTSAPRTAPSTRSARATARIRWCYNAERRRQGRPGARERRSSSSATTAATSTRSAQRDGHQIWRSARAATRFGLGSGNFYSTPAVAFGRVYLGNTDGRVYSFAAHTGKLAWATRTGDYVYSSPAVADVPRRRPDGLHRLLRRQPLRVRRALGRDALDAQGRRQDLRLADVVGDLVFFSEPRRRGLDRARRPHRAQGLLRSTAAPSTPSIADTRAIYLAGYSALFVLLPGRAHRPRPHSSPAPGPAPGAVNAAARRGSPGSHRPGAIAAGSCPGSWAGGPARAPASCTAPRRAQSKRCEDLLRARGRPGRTVTARCRRGRGRPGAQPMAVPVARRTAG